jgi:hypothetical protein
MKGIPFLVAAALVLGLGAALVWFVSKGRALPDGGRTTSDVRPVPPRLAPDHRKPVAGAVPSGPYHPGSVEPRASSPGAPLADVDASRADSDGPVDWPRLLRDASLDELDTLLDRLGDAWGLETRRALLDAVGGWMAAGRIEHVRKGALLLLRLDDPDLVLADVFERCDPALADDPRRRERFEELGYQLADLLSGRRGDALPDERRVELVHALIRFGAAGGPPDRERIVAAALGGARDEEAHAARHLAAMVRDSADARVRALAARELGKVAGMSEILECHGPRLAVPPASPDQAEVDAGMVSGLVLALERRPEAAARVVPVFARILRDWSGEPNRDEVRSSLLGELMLRPIPELEPELRALAADDSSPAAPLARKALRALDALSR